MGEIMNKHQVIALFLCLFSSSLFAQGVYGVFTPIPNAGEKQVGTINPANGAIGLLGNNASVETGSLAMTTGATALNVANNKAYFIGRDALNVSRIYTVDLNTGITDTNPTLTAGYTADNNWGVWYDEPDGVLYALFNDAASSDTIELTVINTTTGAVTQQHGDITAGDGAGGLASGLMTGDSANDRVFTLINGNLYVISTASINTAHFFEVSGEVNSALNTNSVFGLEWHKDTGTMWFLYNEDNVNGDRQLMELMGDDNFNDGDELFQNANYLLDNGDAILTGSGLAALDVQSSTFFFIGRPSSGTFSGQFSLYSVDLVAQSTTIASIQDPQVQTNSYGGIEVLPGPDLALSKSDGDLSAIPGQTVTYTLNYSNATGSGATTGLKLTETVPAETTFVPGSSTAGWVCLPDDTAGSTCEISPGEIGPGGSSSVTFAVQLNDYVSASFSQINNNATIGATNALVDVMAADTTPVTAAPVLAATKTDDDVMDTEPGDLIIYRITASNTGDRAASNVVLTETVPEHTNYVPTVPFDWTCLPDNSAGSVCTSTPTDLAETGLATEFRVQVIASVPAGTTEVSNTVTMSADNAPVDQQSETTPITSAAILSLNKTDGDSTVSPGSSVVYQINYGNSGNQDADSTTITETVLAQTIFDPTSSSPGWTCLPDNTAGSNCSFDLGTLSGGTSASVDFALQLNTPVPGTFTELQNTASMDASNAATVMAQDTTPVTAAVDLRMVKTDGEITAALGKVINYTLISFNEGDRDALQVQLTETVPDHTKFYPPGSTTGWNCVPDNNAGSSCTFGLANLAGAGGKNTTFFAVKVDTMLAAGVNELSNTAAISAANTIDTDQDTELTPIDRVIPAVTLIDAVPSITEITSCSQNKTSINTVEVSFQDDNPGLIGVDDLSNFALIDTGIDQDLQSTSCALPQGDDMFIGVNTLTPGGTATNPSATLTLAAPLVDGQYILMVCDDITDAAGNAIDGDLDGLPGGHLMRQFRVELENLFNNAYFDDCDDRPAALNDWNVLADPMDSIKAVTSVDFDDSSLSGAVHIQSNTGTFNGLEQCVNFDLEGSHTLAVAGLGLPSQATDLNLTMICSYRESPNCQGPDSGPEHQEVFVLPASGAGQWTDMRSLMLLPDNTASAFCAFFLSDPTKTAYEYYLDELTINHSDVIFVDGFEAD